MKLQAETNGTFEVKPLWGTYLLGFANFFWAFVALFTLNRFGRKTLLLFGQLGMTVTLLIVGILLLTKHYVTAYIFILLFVGCFQIGSGSVGLIYCVEVPVDKTSGIVSSGAFIGNMTFALLMETMLASRLQAFGTMLVFAGICLVGFVFVLVLVKESRGLNDRQKKNLYMPSDQK